MAGEPKDVELTSDINFIETPPAKPNQFDTGKDCGITLTNVSCCSATLPN